MQRRHFLATLASTIPLAGCTGGPDDPVTMLAVNEDDSSRSVTVWIVRGERLTVAKTVEVASHEVEKLGEMAWRERRYRVTVRVDDEPVLAEEFQSEAWFNQLDVVIDGGGSVELNRGRAA